MELKALAVNEASHLADLGCTPASLALIFANKVLQKSAKGMSFYQQTRSTPKSSSTNVTTAVALLQVLVSLSSTSRNSTTSNNTATASFSNYN